MSQQWRRRSFERIVILGMLSMFAVGYSAAQEIMLGPRAPAGHTRGPPDWDELFQPNAPWPITAAHTAVFGFSAEHIAELPHGTHWRTTVLSPGLEIDPSCSVTQSVSIPFCVRVARTRAGLPRSTQPDVRSHSTCNRRVTCVSTSREKSTAGSR